jgi:hypothetical protein
MQDTILVRKYGTTGRMGKLGMHNRSEGGRFARDSLCATAFSLNASPAITTFVGCKKLFSIVFSTDYLMCHTYIYINKVIELKLSHYTPQRRLGGEEV